MFWIKKVMRFVWIFLSLSKLYLNRRCSTILHIKGRPPFLGLGFGLGLGTLPIFEGFQKNLSQKKVLVSENLVSRKKTSVSENLVSEKSLGFSLSQNFGLFIQWFPALPPTLNLWTFPQKLSWSSKICQFTIHLHCSLRLSFWHFILLQERLGFCNLMRHYEQTSLPYHFPDNMP